MFDTISITTTPNTIITTSHTFSDNTDNISDADNDNDDDNDDDEDDNADYENSNEYNDIDYEHLEKLIEIVEEIQPDYHDYEKGYCISDNRMSCGKGGFSGETDIPCARNTRPKRLNTTDELNLLREVCPEFLEDIPDGEYPELCCNKRTLYELRLNYDMPKQLGLNRCPSCFYNFRRLYCNLACSPKQSKFLRVDKSVPTQIGNKTYFKIKEMSYFLNRNFANGLYESCKCKCEDSIAALNLNFFFVL